MEYVLIGCLLMCGVLLALCSFTTNSSQTVESKCLDDMVDFHVLYF